MVSKLNLNACRMKKNSLPLQYWHVIVFCFFFPFAGTYKITEYFLYPLGHLAVDPSIYILIQKEVLNFFFCFVVAFKPLFRHLIIN